jgi:carbon monoxide dehydrogenase subunit G
VLIEESFQVTAPIARVWEFIRDPGDGSTKVAYKSDVMVVGRLAKFGFGMMKKKAQSMGAEFAQALKERLEAA